MTTPAPDKLEIPEAAVELLPCPLCNARAQVEELGDDDSYYVSCTGCGLQQIAKYHQSDAIAAWNRRHPHIPDRGYAEGIEAAATAIERKGMEFCREDAAAIRALQSQRKG